MKYARSDWSRFVRRMKAISQKAGVQMEKYIAQHGMENTTEIIQYAFALQEKYGLASASMAAEMYDAIASAEGVEAPAAELAKTATMGEVAKAINGTKDSEKMLRFAVERLVKQAGADTTLKNAVRDGAEFAWIPTGDTCAFCLALASQGWQRTTKNAIKNGHAEHIHANCDCEYAVRFSSATSVAGYDPEQYLAAYEGAEGNTYQQKINALRRADYAENWKKITAQKRAAYAAQKETE